MSDLAVHEDDGHLIDRFKRIMEAARGTIPEDENRNSASVIVRKMLNGTGAFRKQLTGAGRFADFILTHGLNPLTRRSLKTPGKEDELRPEQLALFSDAAERSLVQQINRSAVFVPEMEAFVTIAPGMDPDLLDSAADYLDHHAEDVMRRAHAIRRLASLIRKRGKKADMPRPPPIYAAVAPTSP